MTTSTTSHRPPQAVPHERTSARRPWALITIEVVTALGAAAGAANVVQVAMIGYVHPLQPIFYLVGLVMAGMATPRAWATVSG